MNSRRFAVLLMSLVIPPLYAQRSAPPPFTVPPQFPLIVPREPAPPPPPSSISREFCEQRGGIVVRQYVLTADHGIDFDSFESFCLGGSFGGFPIVKPIGETIDSLVIIDEPSLSMRGNRATICPSLLPAHSNSIDRQLFLSAVGSGLCGQGKPVETVCSNAGCVCDIKATDDTFASCSNFLSSCERAGFDSYRCSSNGACVCRNSRP
jgi:hypothetical protein